jgi:hypothetical protein
MRHTPSLTRRIAELRTALDKGSVADGNHAIEIDTGVVQHESYCRHCPMSVSCYLGGEIVTFAEAAKMDYACVKKKTILFRYHGATVLKFDVSAKTLDDSGYWGYSVSTSRALGWYIQALVELDLVPPNKAHAAVAFFRGRKDQVNHRTNDLPVFQC